MIKIFTKTKTNLQIKRFTHSLAFTHLPATSNIKFKPLIILHGLFGSKNNFLSFAKKPSINTHRNVYLLDLRNHGQSFHHPNHDYMTMKDDIIKFLDDNDMNEVDLLGFSMGGKVAMALSLSNQNSGFQNRIRNLIIGDIAPVSYSLDYRNDDVIIKALNLYKSLDLKSLKRREEADKFFEKDIPNPITRAFLLSNLEVIPKEERIDGSMYRWKLNVKAIDENLKHIFGFPNLENQKFTNPTLFLKGEKSKILTEKHKNEIEKYFPNYEMKLIPNADIENPPSTMKNDNSILMKKPTAAPEWVYNHWILYYSNLIFPFMHLIGLFISYYTNFSISLLLVPFFDFIVMPILDAVVYDALIPYSEREMEPRRRASKKVYKFALYTYTIIQIISFFITTYFACFKFKMNELRYWLASVSLGLIQLAPGVSVAHELLHKLNSFDQFLSKILLTQIGYTHFVVEHLLGHHKNVCTPDDPVTARYNENLYAFFFRASIAEYISAWRLEAKRLRDKGLSFWSWDNRMLHYTFYCLSIPLVLYLLAGIQGLVFFIFQSLIAIFFIEAVNYIEHYGLERKMINGKYEPVSHKHSWDAPYRISCYLSYNLLLHADHHENPTKNYEELRAVKGALEMPYSYSLMALIALVPPLYKRIVHPILEKHKDM